MRVLPRERILVILGETWRESLPNSYQFSKLGTRVTLLSEPVETTIKDVVQKIIGFRRQEFMAKVAEDHFERSAWKTKIYLGWNRDSIRLGLLRRSGILCIDNYQAHGWHESEAINPNLEADICATVDVQSQVDSNFQSTFLYVRISARAVRAALVSENGYHEA